MEFETKDEVKARVERLAYRSLVETERVISIWDDFGDLEALIEPVCEHLLNGGDILDILDSIKEQIQEIEEFTEELYRNTYPIVCEDSVKTYSEL